MNDWQAIAIQCAEHAAILGRAVLAERERADRAEAQLAAYRKRARAIKERVDLAMWQAEMEST